MYFVIIIAFYLVAFTCHNSIRRAAPRLRQITEAFNFLLNPDALEDIRAKDKFMGITVGACQESNAILMSLISAFVARDERFLGDLNLTLGPFMIHIYVISIFGTCIVSMLYFSLMAFMFGKLADQFERRVRDVILLGKSYHITRNDVKNARKYLRVYWELKLEAVHQLRCLPFAWYAFVFIAVAGLYI